MSHHGRSCASIAVANIMRAMQSENFTFHEGIQALMGATLVNIAIKTNLLDAHLTEKEFFERLRPHIDTYVTESLDILTAIRRSHNVIKSDS